MSLRGDDRAQSVQIGAAILLAFLVLAFASYQASVVPSQNEQVEYNHNQEVQSQMQDLRGGIVSVPGGATGRSVSVKLGTRYPERTLFVNPGPPTGNLRTTPPDDIAIENATAAGETGDYWNGTNRTVATRGMVYTANYAVWQNAPRIAYENSVSYNDYRADTILESDQRLVQGRQITVVALNGSYQEASTRTVSVDLEAISTSSNVVTVENTTGDNVTLRFPTRLNETKWNDLLEEQRTTNGGHVVDVSVTNRTGSPYDELVLELEQDVTYRLRMANVGVGTGIEPPDTAYVTDLEGDNASINAGGSQRLVVQVRDEFNNPVTGEVVNATVTSGPGSVTPNQTETDADGRAAFVYSSSTSGTATIEANVSTSPDATEKVEFTVDVVSSGGGNSSAYEVFWKDPSGQSGVSCPSGPDGVCTIDGSKRLKVDLTVATSPTAALADVDYAVNNTSVGTVSPNTGDTGTDGEDTTTLSVREDGSVAVFAGSGGVGDRIDFEVIEVQSARVSYTNNGDLKTITANGTVETHVSSETVTATSSLTDIDGDGNEEIAYVNDNNWLKMVDTVTGDKTTITSGAAYSDASLAVGDANGDGVTEIYYTDTDDDELFKINASPIGTPQPLEATAGTDCKGNTFTIENQYGAVDVTDYDDDDGDAEVVYVSDDTDRIAYFDDENCNESPVTSTSSVGFNGAPGAGDAFEFGGDTVIPIVNSSQGLELVAEDGTVTSLPSTYGDAAKTGIAPRDWDGDGEMEIVHINGNDNNNLYHAGVQDSDLVPIEDENGNQRNGQEETGVR